jgi:hypothetical protein
MSGLENPDPDMVQSAPFPTSRGRTSKSLEGDRGHADELEKKDHANYDQIDQELAKYTGDTVIEVSEEENTRLRRMIDKRVLIIMITTYFLQALDKGTLTFSSIMGIKDDAGLDGQKYQWLTTCIYITILIVEYPQVRTRIIYNIMFLLG